MHHQRKRRRSVSVGEDYTDHYSGRRHSPDSHNHHNRHSKRHRSRSRDRYDGEKSHYHRDHSPKKDDHHRRHHRKYFDEKSASNESSGSSFAHSASVHRPQWREDTSKRKYRSKRPHRSRLHGTSRVEDWKHEKLCDVQMLECLKQVLSCSNCN